NIRELQNLIERLCVISENEIIDDAMITQHITGPSKSLMSGFENLPLEQALEAFEKGIIMAALKKSNNIKNQAAKLLGIPTSSLYYKMEKFQLL
ncbi:MAG TPA: helix-turn-helix domain-containing protein, partial [bacterium]|nr:helix-turn-helix domain-containing protein [bacterium]